MRINLKNILFILLPILLLVIGAIFFVYNIKNTGGNMEYFDDLVLENEEEILLPEPEKDGEVSVEKAMVDRRSVRSFIEEDLTIQEISQLLWSAQGITDSQDSKRASPSAGATYPLEVYINVSDAEELTPGIYKYNPKNHSLIHKIDKDKGEEISNAALGQDFINQAPVNIIITAVYERTTQRYGTRGEQYVHMEAGHAGQNIYLQCESLGLATVAVGAFNDDEVAQILRLSEEENPLYIMPVGKPKD